MRIWYCWNPNGQWIYQFITLKNWNQVSPFLWKPGNCYLGVLWNSCDVFIILIPETMIEFLPYASIILLFGIERPCYGEIQQSPTFLALGISFVEDNFSTGWADSGMVWGWFLIRSSRARPSHVRFTIGFALLWEFNARRWSSGSNAHMGSGCKYRWSFIQLLLLTSGSVAWFPQGLGTPAVAYWLKVRALESVWSQIWPLILTSWVTKF